MSAFLGSNQLQNNIRRPKYSTPHKYATSICRYYNQGLCSFGDRCRYIHSNIPNIIYPDGILPNVPPINSGVSDNDQSTLISSKINQIKYTESARVILKPTLFIPNLDKQRRDCKFKPLCNNENKSEMELCPYAEAHGVCCFPNGQCNYLHGDICQLCGTASLQPFNQEKRKLHIKKCIENHEKNMEYSFALQHSQKKMCGICFEIVLEKEPEQRRFAILPNCNHCFCLGCIRTWRQAMQFDKKVVRGCPECRVVSNFVYASVFWVDKKEEKQKLLEDYKSALSEKNCKHFKNGRGNCPFGKKCFYLHILENGKKINSGSIRRRPRNQFFNIINRYDLITNEFSAEEVFF